MIESTMVPVLEFISLSFGWGVFKTDCGKTEVSMVDGEKLPGALPIMGELISNLGEEGNRRGLSALLRTGRAVAGNSDAVEIVMVAVAEHGKAEV